MANHQVAFALAPFDKQYPVVIDPAMTYSTYLGGDALDIAYAMAIDADYFAIDYVSTDDYRIETYVIATEKYKKQVDDAIKAYYLI